MTVIIFSTLSVLAIVAGGLISAFSARKPTRATAWASAYLVLVVGIIQLGLISVWYRLTQPEATEVFVALLVYNLGNASVIAGTILKKRVEYYRILVNVGGALIGLAMVLLLVAVRGSQASWVLAEFIGLAAAILISMPIGLMLSAKKHKEAQENRQSL